MGIEVGNFPYEQLYNLEEDPSQQKNLAELEPKKLEELRSVFVKLRGNNYTKGVKEVVFQ